MVLNYFATTVLDILRWPSENEQKIHLLSQEVKIDPNRLYQYVNSLIYHTSRFAPKHAHHVCCFMFLLNTLVSMLRTTVLVYALCGFGSLFISPASATTVHVNPFAACGGHI